MAGAEGYMRGVGMRWLWTDAQRQSLCRLYPELTDESVALGIGCTVSQVRGEAKRLGLKKSQQYFAQQHAHLASVGEPSRFRRGAVPVNKGKRSPGLAIGRMGDTQFKKGSRTGRANENWKPVGTVVLRSDGYLWRKINDDLPFYKRWKEVHRIVWETANGPVPKGYCVAFKGERPSVAEEVTLDRLELINLADNARRNAMWTNYPPEVCELIVKRGALNRRIRRLERGQ